MVRIVGAWLQPCRIARAGKAASAAEVGLVKQVSLVKLTHSDGSRLAIHHSLRSVYTVSRTYIPVATKRSLRGSNNNEYEDAAPQYRSRLHAGGTSDRNVSDPDPDDAGHPGHSGGDPARQRDF